MAHVLLANELVQDLAAYPNKHLLSHSFLAQGSYLDASGSKSLTRLQSSEVTNGAEEPVPKLTQVGLSAEGCLARWWLASPRRSNPGQST